MKTPFLAYSASQRLAALAKSPVDFFQSGCLTPDRIHSYRSLEEGMMLSYATERVDEEVLHALEDLANEAELGKKMEEMQRGEIVNQIEGWPGENRPALHTACRDLFGTPQSSIPAYQAAEFSRKELEKIGNFLEKTSFHTLVLIGIGGSYLGPKAHYQALLSYKKSGRQVHFLANMDPDEAAAVLGQLTDLAGTWVAVVSKSGGTLETIVNEELVRSHFVAAGLDARQHFVTVTTPGSPLDDPSRYLERFYMGEWVGGRFSSTSACGLLPLGFAFGMPVVGEFLAGAHAMDQLARESSVKKNLPLLAALLGVWNRNFLGYPAEAILPYSYALQFYPLHLQQLAMESNGKRVQKNGEFVDFATSPILWGEVGTNAQHSFFQLLHQGNAPSSLVFLGCKEPTRKEANPSSQEKLLANLFAQMISLATGQAADNPNRFFPGNTPSHLLFAERLDPKTLGKWLAFFEHKVAFQGFLWGINSFDQEGVQLGKVLAKKIVEDWQDQQPYPLARAYLESIVASSVHG